MSASIGSILQKEREARGLTLAQAAAATHIRQERLRELEQDDFSNFPNPAYARMYFRLYCKYLDIQVTDEIDMLFPGSLAGLDDYEYLRNDPVPPAKRAQRPSRPRKSLTYILATVAFFAVIAGILWMSIAWTARRIGTWGQEVIAQTTVVVEEKLEQAQTQINELLPEARQNPADLDPEAAGAAQAASPPPAVSTAAPPAETTPVTAVTAPETSAVPEDVALPDPAAATGAEMEVGLGGPAVLTSEDGAPLPEGDVPAEEPSPPPAPQDSLAPPAETGAVPPATPAPAPPEAPVADPAATTPESTAVLPPPVSTQTPGEAAAAPAPPATPEATAATPASDTPELPPAPPAEAELAFPD